MTNEQIQYLKSFWNEIEQAAEELGKKEKPEKKENPITTRKKLRFRTLTDAQKQDAIRENPLYGRVICRCETITEGEIVWQKKVPDSIRYSCNL